MKRALVLTSSLLILAGCGREPAPPPPGGQSGDDGDVSGDEGGLPDPIPPGLPPDPCEREVTELALDTATPFGATALELVGNVAPASASPLFWVPYQGSEGVTYTPGPGGETAATLGIAPRSGESATFGTYRPRFGNAEADCFDDMIRVPVHVTLQSADGALDASSDADLLFTSATTAELQTGFAIDALGGSFTFDSLGDPARSYVATGLSLEAQLWPGGSRGALYPSIELPTPELNGPGVTPPAPSGELTGPVGPTPPPPATTPATPTPGVIAAPIRSEHSGAIAVWPRLETCASDGRGGAYAYAASDRVIGSSLAEIVDAINAQGPFTVSLGDETALLEFEARTPSALSCAAPLPFGTVLASRSVRFDVQATLRADGDGSALDQLDATSVFEITATSAADGTLAALRWARRDLFVGQSRNAFESATGITLDAPAEYEQLWWSWHASDTRESGSEPGSLRGALVVSSLNAEDAAEIARIQAQGGPGVSFTFDETTHFPVMPGDTLIDAEIVP